MKRALTLLWPLVALPALAHGPHGEPRAIPYRVEPVAHPARITGHVRWTGALPALAPLAVPVGNPVCGAQTANPALRVDPGSRAVANAVVYLLDITHGAAVPPVPVTVMQAQCAFAPHVVATTVGSLVRFGNRDAGVLHNVHAFYGLEGDEAMFNLASPAGITLARAVDREGIHRVVCDAGHTWMLLYLHVFDHPYYAVTGDDGAFTLGDVPAGTYQLRAWHEGWSIAGTDAHGRPVWHAPYTIDTPVTVHPDGTVTADVTLNADGTGAWTAR